MFATLTGGSGFIGNHLLNTLKYDKIVNLGRRHINTPGVSSYLCDLSKEDWVREFFKNNKPDIIFHFAGNPMVKSEPEDHLNSNLLSTLNLLKWCPEGCRFVFASSITVYGDCFDQMNEESVCKPTSVYSSMKLASEHLINSFIPIKGIRPLIARLGATVGSGTTHGLMHDVIRKLKNNPTLELLGKAPGPFKPFTHIDDVINAILTLDNFNGTINICNDDAISVLTVAETIMEEMNMDKEIVWLDNNWKGDNTKLLVSNEKLASQGYIIDCLSADAIRKAVYESLQPN